MSSRHLLEPITDQGIRSVKFFNGRILPAEDLTQEQQANEARRRQLGRAIGEGVVYGFEVSRKDARIITVEAGLTINCRGHAFALGTRVDIDLVTAPAPGAVFTDGCCLHQDCQPPESGIYVAGAGLYLLLVSPATTQEGRAEVSGLGNEAARCNARYCVEGVQFRLLQITPAPELQAPTYLRNAISYRCFGYPAQGMSQLMVPSCGGVTERYGLVDDLRPDSITCCEVPIALLYLTAGDGIVFIDLYAVRRRVTRVAISHPWNSVIGDRRFSEGEAMYLQFQDQLIAIGGEMNVQLKNIRAVDRFRYLPAAGHLSVGSTGFDWKTFLGPHAPASETPMDAALLRSILHQSFFEDPIAVDKTPRAAVSVYRDPTQSDCVLFARTFRGRIRVTLNPIPPDFEVYAQQGDCQTHYCPFAGTAPAMLDLFPGDYDVYVTATGYEAVASQPAHVVGGEQVELSFELTPIPVPPPPPPGPTQCVRLKDGKEFSKGTRLCMLKNVWAVLDAAGKIKSETLKGAFGKVDVLQAVQRWKKVTDSSLPSWLSSWTKEFEDKTKLILGRAKPFVAINPEYKPPRNELTVPRDPQAIAVFDVLVVPLLVNDPQNLNPKAIELVEAKIPALSNDQIKKLNAYDITTLDHLSGAWVALVSAIEKQNEQWAAGLIFDAFKEVTEKNHDMAYYNGMDEVTKKALADIGIADDVGLANANVRKLGEALGSEGVAYRLINQARDIAPEETWSLVDLGLGQGEITELAKYGIESQGDFVLAAADDVQHKVLSSVLEADDPAINNLSLSSITNMTVGSINLRPETELIALPGVNEVIAVKLAAANISSTADLVTADAAKVAETSGLSESTIANLIAAAKVADRGTIDLSSLPTVSSQAANLEKKFKVKTVSDLAGKSPSEIAAAFGGDETKAAAVIAGAKIALGKAIRG